MATAKTHGKTKCVCCKRTLSTFDCPINTCAACQAHCTWSKCEHPPLWPHIVQPG